MCFSSLADCQVPAYEQELGSPRVELPGARAGGWSLIEMRGAFVAVIASDDFWVSETTWGNVWVME